jgi:glycerol-3-phosphate dehydrogenase
MSQSIQPLPGASRAAAIEAFHGAPLDILVIGGGIVGSGIARDAAMRGLRVGLVEQNDFAFGTSSRSSRLLHGGMRYLAQGRLGLVREASVEKKILHHIAPHIAEPLPFVFPTYRANPQWKLWQLKIGVKIYDLLCGGKNLGNSTWLNRAAALERVSGLREHGLSGAVRYFDGLTNDARLVLDTLRSAVNNGAFLLNYFKFQSAAFDRPEWTCELTDQLTGAHHEIRARAIVNATGPWADGLSHSRVKLRLTKGIHLVVDRARLPVPDAVVMTEGKRILFAIPWADRTILGTTDTDYHGPLDKVFADAGDIRYLLQIANDFFPSANLAHADVIRTWAGLRPLLADPNGKPSDISRNHEIKNPEPGWWDVAGGKLTTYRLMAEQTVDKVIAKTGLEASECRTAEEPLLPRDETANINAIAPPDFSRAIVEHACAREWAVHLDDVMVRRTGWHYYHRDAAQKAALVADWMKRLFNWSDRDLAAELARYNELLNHQPTAETSSPDHQFAART